MRLLLAAVVMVSVPASADPPLAPVTSRDYAIDLYNGVSLGNSAVIAMGGATVANAIGSSGTLANPSAAAVRQTTDTDRWSWDYHLDYLNASQSRDFSNSGLGSVTGSGATMTTAGLSLRVRDWGGALTASFQSVPLAQPVGAATPINATTLHGRLAIAHWFASRDIAIGVAADLAQLDIKPTCTGCASLFTINGVGFVGGASYIPRWRSYRIGVAGNGAFAGGNVTTTSCDPNNCDGYILPDAVRVPWSLAAGMAMRFAGTEWNQLVGGDFRDEPAVTVAVDGVVTGSTPDAYGLDAFGLRELERSGRHVSWSLRGGAEYEWLPGRLRVRAGSYWEPGRFVGVDGRLHGTFGIEVRVFEFHAWGRRRGRLTLTGDVASQYDNVALSIGFWH